MKILHVAPINVAGVPFNMMEMQRRSGHKTNLITLHRNTLTFPEDICLDLPLPRNAFASLWRRHKRTLAESEQKPLGIGIQMMRIHSPENIAERLYFWMDDKRRATKIERAIIEFGLDDYDVIHYDGGLDFFRDSRLAKEWKAAGKKIVCHYMGSDLRIRGVDPTMNMLSDLNLTNESDHLFLHPDIHYIFIPFDVTPYKVRTNENKRLRIIHSPSNRDLKGTKYILPVMDRLAKERNIEFILLENRPHSEVLSIKETCDIAIEQVGNLGGTGYGRNSLESLALGIPTVTEMTQDYIEWLPENPFVLATPETLFERLIDLIDNKELRRQHSKMGRAWIEKYHSYDSVNARLTALYREYNII